MKMRFVRGRGWSVTRGSTSFVQYLHRDGVWRKTTTHQGDTKSGWFDSEVEARKVAEKKMEVARKNVGVDLN